MGLEEAIELAEMMPEYQFSYLQHEALQILIKVAKQKLAGDCLQHVEYTHSEMGYDK